MEEESRNIPVENDGEACVREGETLTLYQRLLKKEEEQPDAHAVVIDGEHFTYEDVLSEVDVLSAAFEECNVSAGTVITVCLPDNLQKLFCTYALNKIGAVADIVEPGLFASELSHHMEKNGSECLVMMDTALSEYAKMLTEADPGMVVVCRKGDYFSFAKKRFRRLTDKTPAPDCPKEAFYTTYVQMRRFGREILSGKLDNTYDWPSAFEEVAPEKEKEEYIPKCGPEETAVILTVKEEDGKKEEVKVSSETPEKLPDFLRSLISEETVTDVK